MKLRRSFRVMTFNIRYDNPGDGENGWVHRKDKVASMIRLHQADIAGLQEALKHQITSLPSGCRSTPGSALAETTAKTAGSSRRSSIAAIDSSCLSMGTSGFRRRPRRLAARAGTPRCRGLLHGESSRTERRSESFTSSTRTSIILACWRDWKAPSDCDRGPRAVLKTCRSS